MENQLMVNEKSFQIENDRMNEVDNTAQAASKYFPHTVTVGFVSAIDLG